MSKKRQQSTKFITRDILKSSVIGAFQKLDPRYMLKNPVMFVVEVGFLITLVLCFVPNLFGDVQALAGKLPAASLRTYNVIVTLILFITVLFANFAESVADIRRLMEYYLPTTVKLLEAYEELDAQPIQGENITSSKTEIEKTLDTLNIAFEKLLDDLFQDTAWDVSSDISVLHTMLAQEGLTEDEISGK